MDIEKLIGSSVGAMVVYGDGSSESRQADSLASEVKALAGADAPVYCVNLASDPVEANRVKIDMFPTIVIYRSHREVWRLTPPFPSAQVLAERLEECNQPAGAVNPLKGRPRDW